MKKMKKEEINNELVKMLKHFNEFCRKNKIEYSLIGGSLIGAIRHKGMIPWDDDIDIILTRENYTKLKKIYNNKNTKKDYVLYDFDFDDRFYFPFMKLMNMKTKAIEHNSHKKLENYGIFIDIFCYTETPEKDKDRYKFFKKIKKVNSLLCITSPFEKNLSFKIRILRLGKIIVTTFLGKKRIHEIGKKIFFSSEFKDSEYVVSNWPVYSYSKEIQKKEDIQEYINVNFEGIEVMIFKNYDNILRNTFGNYMELPPKEKRINHNMDVYWIDKK